MEFAELKLKTKNFLLFLRRPRWFKLYVSDKFVTPDYENQQYFFTSESVKYLVDHLDHFENPCCVGTPSLVKEWFERGRNVRLLDIDKRFNFLPGYKYYDITKPDRFDEKFDVIIMDPTFGWGEGILLKTVNILSHNNHSQKIFLVHMADHELSILEIFKDYQLKPTEYYPKYANLRGEGRKFVKCFANFDFP